MKIENTTRNKKGQTNLSFEPKLAKDIKKLYKKYKKENIDYDSFHLLICDLSSINRTFSIALESCND